MKTKISITISDPLLDEIDALNDFNTRSSFIEKAVVAYIQTKKREKRDQRDLEIINEYAAELNEEALDALKYQIDL